MYLVALGNLLAFLVKQQQGAVLAIKEHRILVGFRPVGQLYRSAPPSCVPASGVNGHIGFTLVTAAEPTAQKSPTAQLYNRGGVAKGCGQPVHD